MSENKLKTFNEKLLRKVTKLIREENWGQVKKIFSLLFQSKLNNHLLDLNLSTYLNISLSDFYLSDFQVLFPGYIPRFYFQVLFLVLFPSFIPSFYFQVLFPGFISRFYFQVLFLVLFPGYIPRFYFQVLFPGFSAEIFLML